MSDNSLKFFVSYKFFTNFPPLTYNSNISKIYLKFMQKIILNDSRWQLTKQFCKNFLIFLCILNYFYKNKYIGDVKLSKPKLTIFVLPTKNKIFTLLKAPFVNKLSKKHYIITRYKIVISIHYNIKKYVNFNNYSQLNLLLKFIVELFSYFESNICYNYKINVIYQFYLKK